MNFNNYTIYLKQINSFNEVVYGISNLLAIELLETNNQKDNYIEIKTDAMRIQWKGKEDKTIGDKIVALIEVVISYAVSSIVTSLYIYATIIASPSVILLFLRLTRYGRN